MVYHEDVYVNGVKIEQVTTANHLGYIFTETTKYHRAMWLTGSQKLK